jgi:ornithine cyclodeaminase/alanine dehydrogenase
MAVARNVSRALVFDVSDEAVTGLVRDLKNELDMEIRKAEFSEEVLDADIICTATSSPTPLFNGDLIKAGTHINGIGSHTPNARELDSTTIRRSKLVGDSREACFKEAGDIMIPLSEGAIGNTHFHAELGEVITGMKPGRTDDNEITIFKSNGLAIQDAATARLVYDRALKAGVGTRLEI